MCAIIFHSKTISNSVKYELHYLGSNHSICLLPLLEKISEDVTDCCKMLFQTVEVDVKLATMRMRVLLVLRAIIKPWMAKIIFARVNINVFV